MAAGELKLSLATNSELSVITTFPIEVSLSNNASLKNPLVVNITTTTPSLLLSLNSCVLTPSNSKCIINAQATMNGNINVTVSAPGYNSVTKNWNVYSGRVCQDHYKL